MTTELRVETFHTEAIKPSSPTPINLKTFKLSLLDQMTPVTYIPLIFWYRAEAASNDKFSETQERSRRLKKSLSETLTRFYPFAGRISNSLIECNDEGVDYIEARVNCLLQDILKKPDGQVLTKFLPIKTESTEAATGRILLVKVNFFQCGGMAIGVSISHKIADLCTLGKFVNSWAATTRGSSEVVFPEFGCAASFLPPTDLSFTMPAMEFNHQRAAMRRLVFDASKISMLKARSASRGVPQPTRVQAVAALIWKCGMVASTSNLGGFTKPSVLRQVVNLRKRLKPPLPENSVGYLVSYFTVQTQDSEMELQGLVQQLKNGIREFSENYVKKLQGTEAISTIFEAAKEVGNLSKRYDIDFYNCLSWCGFDLYEADFGWGKPIWVSVAGATTPNIFLLMDTRDGEGIEAWVALTEPEMAFFEHNEELLTFASVDPSVSS
ncbi:BAHD acyltransferase BIA1-like [Durio zibethinus]|uniref:BAHD acyltransferase BIA1-like n=1 Tax=Durio zibethinus TaxID=66656 RepID=A0A6P5XCR9_DURZI|nr:BAHD acyltransferase BIA1-like [Durio zibethinus]